MAVNDRMPVYAYEFLREQHGSLNGARVLLLGVSYRGEVGDTRFSPVDLFYGCLQADGARLTLHDPYVPYWPEKEREVHQDLQTALADQPQVVVISTGHQLYKRPETIEALMALEGLFIYDTIGVLSAEQIVRLRERHTVKVLGRGDL